MIKVSLHGAEFFAFHGFYPQEQLTGNLFVVDIDVIFEPAAGDSPDHITGTVNYEQLYAIAEEEMRKTKKLLEAAAGAIAGRIRADFAFVQQITVVLKKINPPLPGVVAWSAVTVTDDKNWNYFAA